MDAEGLLKKIHGGATLLDEEVMREEYTVETKYSLHTDEKRRIAKMAALMIHDSDFVYLDAGTTTECLLDYLTCRDTVFVTNGLQIARRLSSQGHTVYLPAGRVKFVTDAVVGGRAHRKHQLLQFHPRLFRRQWNHAAKRLYYSG